MDTSTVSSTTQSSRTTTATTASTSTTLTSDFDTFLQMLTAQARYQDPLEPIDSSEYAAQLAQFSMVEQQVLTNDTLSELVGKLTGTTLNSLSSWVGMEVRTSGPVQFDGSPISVSPQTAADADRAKLVVRDAEGDVVQELSLSLPLSTDLLQWAGTKDDGSPFSKGLYSFEVENINEEGKVFSTIPVETYALVTEAQNRDGQPVLLLPGGITVAVSNITAVRQPS